MLKKDDLLRIWVEAVTLENLGYASPQIAIVLGINENPAA
jgi:hypothetical protein